MNKEADQPKGLDSQRQGLAKIGKTELQEFLAQHNRWVESKGKEGAIAVLGQANLQEAYLERASLGRADLQEADLRGANLQKADLNRANLQKADLRGAKLQGAYLEGAELQGADLREAKLQGAELQGADLRGAKLQEAYLSGAKLQGADLRGAKLQGADLTGADLRGTQLRGANFRGAFLRDAKLRKENDDFESAKGLQGQNLAGADVSLATLPEDIHKFEALTVIEEASKNARKIFISVLIGCVYFWLTIATTTDARLLTNSSSSPLPIIQTAVPIAGFYWAAPFVLLCVFVYLQLYLQRLWEVLAEMPAVFPDGRPLDKRAYPWLLSGLVRAHFKLLQKDRPLFSRLQSFISILLAWWLVPLTLLLFWVSYLPRRDDWIWLHAALLVIAVGFATWSQLSARRTLRGQPPIPFRERWGETSKQTEASGRMKAYGSFLVYLLGRTLPMIVALAVAVLFDQVTPVAIANRPANLVGADVSTKPANWTGKNTEDEIALVKGVQLVGIDLRNAEASGAFLVKADLTQANLQGANLNGANLQEARLILANLQGAILLLANLQGAKLNGANLQEANLPMANLQGALLTGASLQGADLTGANLRGADLSNANLQGASLQWAILTGANLQGALELTQQQLNSACGDAETKLPPGMSVKPCPEESN